MLKFLFLFLSFSFLMSATETSQNNTTSPTSTPATNKTTPKPVPTVSTNITTVINAPEHATPRVVTDKPTKPAKPITLTITPDVKEYGGDYFEDYNLFCTVSGDNLYKIGDFDLGWYEQGSEGRSKAIKVTTNHHIIVLHHDLAMVYAGSQIYCALIFNKISPTHFATMKSDYVFVKHSRFGKRHLDSKSNSNLTVGLLTALFCTLILGAIAAFFYRKSRRNKTRSPPIAEELPSMSAQENIYSYVPLETVPFYQAKAMAASNQTKKMESVKPPPLPERPETHQSLKDEEEYIYSYAYGVKKTNI